MRSRFEMEDRYPELSQFMGTQYLQDPPSPFPTLEEATAEHRKYNDQATIDAVVSDIHRFLSEQHNDIETAFAAMHPHIYLPAIGYTPAEWLRRIAELLSSPADQHKSQRSASVVKTRSGSGPIR